MAKLSMPISEFAAMRLGREVNDSERKVLTLLTPQGIAKVNHDMLHGYISVLFSEPTSFTTAGFPLLFSFFLRCWL